VFPEVRSTVTGQDERLEFMRLHKEHWETRDGTIDYMNLIFDATLGGVEVLAKIVLRSYGKGVHAHLAAQDMAPQLYGTSGIHGVAGMVVMGLLGDGWMTLFDYRNNRHRDGIPEDRRGRLLQRLEGMLDSWALSRWFMATFGWQISC
jgi:hypothetical protein